MKKLFLFLSAILLSTGLWAETFTMSSIFTGSNQSATVDSPVAATVSTTSSASNAKDGKLGSDGNYFQIVLTSRTFTAASLNGYINTTSTDKNWGFQFSTNGGTSWAAEVTQANDGTKSAHDIDVGVTIPSGANGIRIIRRAGTSTVVNSITLTLAPNCTEPGTPLSLTSDAADAVYAGDEITLSIDGGNGAAVSLKLDGENYDIANKWTATTGHHVFLATQAANTINEVLYCAQEDSIVFDVLAATPVSSVSVAGESAAYVGTVLTYTATAANATQYEWYLDGAKQGSDSAKFIYTAVKGSHSIVCKARNNFNEVGEWISSTPKALTVTNPSGVLIAATAETSSGSIDKNITATGIIGGTVHQKTQKNAKLGSSGHYFSLTLSSGSFLEGDTVKVVVTPEYNSDKKTYSAPSVLKISTTVGNTNLIGESDTKTIDPASSADLYFDIVLTDDASIIYLARDGSICKQNPIVKSISVVRPKEVKSTTETLTNVKINGVAISAANLETLLADESLDIADDYLNAPTVKFFKNIRTTYDDDTYADKADSTAVTAEDIAGEWSASAEINSITYTVTMAKTPSYTVTYKLGSRTLGEELVVKNGNPADYEDYESIDNNGLSEFVAWYSKSDLSGDAVTMGSAVITKDTTFYAKFNISYATSVNIEQLVLDNGTGYDLMAYMGGLNYATNITNSLDTLNDLENKTNRNYAYLGLKVKAAGKLLNFRLANTSVVKVKFGNVSTTPLVSINGGEYEDMAIDAKGIYSYTATGEDLVSIKTADGTTLIFKQIMIDEDTVAVELPAPGAYLVSLNNPSNGKIAANWTNKKYRAPIGAIVTLTATPDDGYKVASITLDGEPLSVTDNTASFVMPSKDVSVVATFSVVTALDNIDADAKAVKVLENGQVVIFKDGKYFNVLGIQIR